MEIQDSGLKIQNLDEKGIALVLVLIIAMISLAIVSAMLFMATQGTVISGAQKFYGSAEEASVGAVDIATEYLSTAGVQTVLSIPWDKGCNCQVLSTATDNIDNETGARSCRCDKLCNATANWDFSADTAISCRDNVSVASTFVSLDPTLHSDFTFNVGSGSDEKTIYVKIVDTVLGNTITGGVVTSDELGGTQVSASSAGFSPAPNPFLYRMEVQAQATSNPREISKVSVLYAH